MNRRGSIRLASKSIKKVASNLPFRKKRRIEKLAESGDVWSAVRKLYNIEKGNVSVRNVVRRSFRPKMRKYNASKNEILNKNNANKAIMRSIRHKNIANILVPLSGNSRGGVDPAYVANAIKNTNIKYAIVNRNTGTLKALALVKNEPNSRYINVIAGYSSYGHPMMNKILSNARNANKKRVNLKAVVQSTSMNKNANMDPLVRWYKSKGFVRSGKLNEGQLLPMSRVLFTRSRVQ